MPSKVKYEPVGDSVYVGFDGHQFILRANSSEYPTDIIYLEPQVWENLVKFVEQFKEGGSEEI